MEVREGFRGLGFRVQGYGSKRPDSKRSAIAKLRSQNLQTQTPKLNPFQHPKPLKKVPKP